MNIQERIDTVLNCLQHCDKECAGPSGIKISKIKELFLKACDILVLDSDIKLLFEKEYVEYYNLSGMDVRVYIHSFNGSLKITAKGYEYLEEGKAAKKIPPLLEQLIKDDMIDGKENGHARL